MDELTQEFIAESIEGLDRMERCLTELEQRPDDSELLSEIFRAVHTIKGATGFLGFSRLEHLAHAGENLLGALREGKLVVSDQLITGLLRLLDGLRMILNLIATTGGEGARASDQDDELIALMRSLNVSSLQAAPDLEAPESSLSEQRPEAVPEVTSGAATADKTLRIDVEVLNRMMNLVGELVLTRNQMLQSHGGGSFPELARRLDSVTADLRETVMQARMQPVGNLFGKFPRLVRDLAKICGKSVRIELHGQETGLDKSLLEAIKDPMTHMVRNSVDHGIEPPEARTAAGKNPEGCLRLRAFQQSGSVVIEVTDDGAGIAINKVLSKAMERGLVTAERAAEMSEREALQMIFLPGFSTAAAVTNVSGRGVGMDVVRSNVEKVGGSVEVESEVGTGTTLRLRVPLTLAIVPALVVRSAGQSFALPQSALVELVYVPSREIERSVERLGSVEVYRLRDRLLPLVRLADLLHMQAVEQERHGLYIAVLDAENCRFGLIVDDLLAPEEIVVKPLSAILREAGLFSGATVLGNGSLALIVDVVSAAQRAGVKPVEEAGDKAPKAVSQQKSEQFLLYEDRSCERTALPLALVERIERLPSDRIERAAGRLLLQYDGGLLPIEDESGMLQDSLHETDGLMTVLICRATQGRSRFGLLVRSVLDVSSGQPCDSSGLFHDAELALVNERVAAVRRDAGSENPEWQEVA